MEEKDPIEKLVNSAFSDFEKGPPDRVWEKLQAKLHPEPAPAGFWARLIAFFHLPEWPVGWYLVLAGTAVSLMLTMGYFGLSRHHMIRGHAYAGELRLCRGTAMLFEVADKTMAWDSVSYFRSAIIDDYGHFQFSHVRDGNYILRIAPERNSEAAKKFLPSWFDRCEKSDSCLVIHVNTSDVNVEAHLILKR